MNNIINADCLKLLENYKKRKFDLCISDPPYFILNKSDIKFKNRKNIIQSATFDYFKNLDEYLEFTTKWVKLINNVMKVNCSMYIFFAIQYISQLIDICTNLGFKLKTVIIWHKNNPAPQIRKVNYISSFEAVGFFVKGKPTFNFLGQTVMHNCFDMPLCNFNERVKLIGSNKVHPTQKPYNLIKRFVEVSSNENDWVIDPFCGVGTTNISCKDLNRKCLGIEINKQYVNAGNKYLSEYTTIENRLFDY